MSWVKYFALIALDARFAIPLIILIGLGVFYYVKNKLIAKKQRKAFIETMQSIDEIQQELNNREKEEREKNA